MVFLRVPVQSDEPEIIDCYKRSISIHQPWVYEPKSYADYLAQEGRFFLCLDDTGEVVGTFNISGIIRGSFQSAYLGYEVFFPHQWKGYMGTGIRLILKHAFSELNLHRLEANVQPDNTNSIRLLKNAGFVKEGFSKNYLSIGGLGWRDHERWAIINHDWEE